MSTPVKKIKIESEKETAIFRSLYLGYFKELAEENERLKKGAKQLDRYQKRLDVWNVNHFMCNGCLDHGYKGTHDDDFDYCFLCDKCFCRESCLIEKDYHPEMEPVDLCEDCFNSWTEEHTKAHTEPEFYVSPPPSPIYCPEPLSEDENENQ